MVELVGMKRHLHAAGVAVMCSMGCNYEDTVPLTDEQLEHVRFKAEMVDATNPLTHAVIDAADEKFHFGADQDGTAVLHDDLEKTTKLVHEFVDTGRIVGYYASQAKSEEVQGAGGFYHDTIFAKGYIALDLESEGSWGPGLLLHEGGHKEGKHKARVNDELDRQPEGNIDFSDPELIAAIVETKDYSYLLSLVAAPSDLVTQQIEFELGAAEWALEKIQNGEAYVVGEWMNADLARDKEGWTTATAERVWSSESMIFTALGVTKEELTNGLRDSGIYEYARSEYDETVKEINREISAEQRREGLQSIVREGGMRR